MVNLTLKQCTYVLAVAEQGGIAQAARVLNISQPAVAQALDKLEDLYGLRLFLRHHARGTELTPQGRAFCCSARALLRQADQTERDAQAIAADLAGTLRFGCFHTLAPFYLARLVTAYREQSPDVEIDAGELRQDEILAGLAEADLDLALTYDLSLKDQLFERQVLARLKPFILLSAAHPKATRGAIPLAEMAEEPFVMFEGPSSGAYFDGLLAAHGIAPPVAFRSGSMESVRCAVARGIGFSLSVMRPGHPETYDGGRVASVPIADDPAPLAVVLLRGKAASTSRLVDQFADFCQVQFVQDGCADASPRW